MPIPHHWRRHGSVWRVAPPRPVGVIQFIGGSYLAVQPQLAYRRLLTAFEAMGWAVLSWAYTPNFDHQAQADEAFTALAHALRRETGWSADLPVVRLGHSLGCKLHLLAPDGGRGCDRAVLLGFNNFSAERSIPFLATARSCLGMTMEFSPSPGRTLELVSRCYQQPRNLLVRFQQDGLDQSARLHQQLRARPGDCSMLMQRPGDHLAPAGAGLRQRLLGRRTGGRTARSIAALAREIVHSPWAHQNAAAEW